MLWIENNNMIRSHYRPFRKKKSRRPWLSNELLIKLSLNKCNSKNIYRLTTEVSHITRVYILVKKLHIFY